MSKLNKILNLLLFFLTGALSATTVSDKLNDVNPVQTNIQADS